MIFASVIYPLKMFKKAIPAIIVLSFLFVACKHNTRFKEVQAPNLFTLQVPDYMHATGDLFKDGKTCLQYENDSAQVFLLVFDTTRKSISENTLKAFYDSIVSNPAIKDPQIAPAKFAMLNKDSSMYTEMTGIAYGVKTYYKILVVATPPRFYYILLWTRDDRKEALKEDLDKIMGSFADIKQ
jgi:hypothetical protein